jgi:hypothetical protein
VWRCGESDVMGGWLSHYRFLVWLYLRSFWGALIRGFLYVSVSLNSNGPQSFAVLTLRVPTKI